MAAKKKEIAQRSVRGPRARSEAGWARRARGSKSSRSPSPKPERARRCWRATPRPWRRSWSTNCRRKRGCSDGEDLGDVLQLRGGRPGAARLPRGPRRRRRSWLRRSAAARPRRSFSAPASARWLARWRRTISAPSMSIDHAALRGYTPGAYVGALAPAIQAAKPDYVIFPHTYQSVDYVPRLAQAVDAGLITDATGFEPGDGGDSGLVWKRPDARRQAPGARAGQGRRARSSSPSRRARSRPTAWSRGSRRSPAARRPDLIGIKADREILGYRGGRR